MFEEQRKARTEIYDAKVKGVIEELLSYGFGWTALMNALNERGVPNTFGKQQTVSSVRNTLKRLGITINR